MSTTVSLPTASDVQFSVRCMEPGATRRLISSNVQLSDGRATTRQRMEPYMMD